MTWTVAALRAEAAQIVAECCGSRTEPAEEIRHGVMTFKFQVQTRDAGRFIVRFYPPSRRAVVDCEPDLLARCRAAGIPVPSVVGDSRTGPAASLAYVVYHMIDGVMLSEHLHRTDSGQQTILARELAQVLSGLRNIDFDGYGELRDATTASDPSWPAFVTAACQAGLESLESHRTLDVATERALRSVLARKQDIGPCDKPRLIWGDIRFDNILVDARGHVAGLIDFESCLSGDPLATLGYCFAAHADHGFCGELLGAWPVPLGDVERERILFYALLRGLRLARYAHLPLPTGGSRDSLVQVLPGMFLALSRLSSATRGGV